MKRVSKFSYGGSQTQLPGHYLFKKRFFELESQLHLFDKVR